MFLPIPIILSLDRVIVKDLEVAEGLVMNKIIANASYQFHLKSISSE